MECLICNEQRETFSEPCAQCSHVLCLKCSLKINSNTCPFCRFSARPYKPVVYEPAVVTRYVERAFYTSGALRSVSWLQDGQFHRERGPAIIEYHPQGHIICQRWYYNGLRHCTTGPALISTRTCCMVEKWYNNDVLHRLNGPAVIIRCDTRHHRLVEQTWINGEMVMRAYRIL